MYLVNNPRHCKGRDRRRPFLTTEKGPKSCCVVDVAAIKTGLAELEPSILIISFPSIYLPGRSVGGSVGRKHGPQPTGQQRKVKPQKQVDRPSIRGPPRHHRLPCRVYEKSEGGAGMCNPQMAGLQSPFLVT